MLAFFSKQPYKIYSSFIPSPLIWKLRLENVKYIDQGHADDEEERSGIQVHMYMLQRSLCFPPTPPLLYLTDRLTTTY